MTKGQRKKANRRARRLRLFFKQHGRCHYCDCRMSLEVCASGVQPPNLATFEHLVPRSQGGMLDEDNTVLACFGCNNGRGNGDARDIHLREMGWL